MFIAHQNKSDHFDVKLETVSLCANTGAFGIKAQATHSYQRILTPSTGYSQLAVIRGHTKIVTRRT